MSKKYVPYRSRYKRSEISGNIKAFYLMSKLVLWVLAILYAFTDPMISLALTAILFRMEFGDAFNYIEIEEEQ